MWSRCMPNPEIIKPAIPKLESISTIICDLLEVDEDIILSKSRKGDIVFVRQLIQATAVSFLNYYKAPWTVAKIGETFGGVNHEAVLHSAKQVRDMIRFKYNIDKIALIADEFNLLLSDYHYSPRMKFTYSNIVFKSDTETLRFDTTSDAAKYFNLSISNVTQSLANEYRLMRKYKGTYDIIKSNYD